MKIDVTTQAVQTQVQSDKKLNLIWAQTVTGVIGDGNTIPWHVPEDLQHFKDMTDGHAVIMGRRTWDSLPEKHRPLPKRTNIVITRQIDLVVPGAIVVNSLDAALDAVPAGQEPWVMGGSQIYAEALERASRLVVTYIDARIEGDAKAPTLKAGWRLRDFNEWRESTSGLRYRIAEGERIN